MKLAENMLVLVVKFEPGFLFLPFGGNFCSMFGQRVLSLDQFPDFVSVESNIVIQLRPGRALDESLLLVLCPESLDIHVPEKGVLLDSGTVWLLPVLGKLHLDLKT